MLNDLHWSDTVYGPGAGLMFTSSALLVGAFLVLLLPAQTVDR